MIAPFLPFLAESFHEALGGSRSVHLEDWPAARPDWRDRELTAEMADVRTVIRLARGIRENHRISHRQPLRSVAIANVSEETLERNRDILLEELNVKAVHSLHELDRYVRSVVKLNYPILGKRLKGEMAAVRAAVDAGQFTMSEDRTKLLVHQHELSENEFQVQFEPISEQTGVTAEGRFVVVLDLTIDAALKTERYARDVNRGVQDLRKDAGLEYDDRIVLGIAAPETVATAIAEDRPWLAEQALAVAIQLEPLAAPAARKEITIDDERIEITLSKADAPVHAG
jgi:isoleucyl-tRNA synthetase